MDRMNQPIDDTAQMVVCPVCGNQQTMSGVDDRCDRCGALLNPAGSDKEGVVGGPIPGKADPEQVPPAMVAGGIGRTTDGTQVPQRVPSAIPGKPMAPTARDPLAGTPLEGQEVDRPTLGRQAAGGGSG